MKWFAGAVGAGAIGAIIAVPITGVLGSGPNDPAGSPQPARADVTIRPGQGIGPIGLRTSKEDVDRSLGRSNEPPPLGSGYGGALQYRSRKYGDFLISYSDERFNDVLQNPNDVDPAAIYVSSIYTEDPRYKLRVGGDAVSTGSSFEAVRAAVRGDKSQPTAWKTTRCAQDSIVAIVTAFGNLSEFVRTLIRFPPTGPSSIIMQFIPPDQADTQVPCVDGGE